MGANASRRVPHIGNVVVERSFRRSGIGQQLMQGALDVAKTWKHSSVYCCVHASNIAAVNLYTRKLGFKIIYSKAASGGLIDHVLEKIIA